MVGHLITSEDNQQATTINTKYSFVYNQSSQATTEDRRKMITPSELSLHLDSYKILLINNNK